MNELIPPKEHTHDEPPPFLGTWERVYVAVLIYLAILIVVMYLFSKAVAA